MKLTLLTMACIVALTSHVFAQLGGVIPLAPLGGGGGAGGFDPTMALAPDLQQQVSSAGGLPLDMEIRAAFPTLWPGYSNAGYNQNPVPGTPEGDMATTLGTFEGTLQAGADQQNSQIHELARLEQLEIANALALDPVTAIQVGNEIALLESELDMKGRNATNALLNALVVAESNKQNRRAEDELQSMAVAGQLTDWDLTNANMTEQDPQVPE
jgi:hypothetical protein